MNKNFRQVTAHAPAAVDVPHGEDIHPAVGVLQQQPWVHSTMMMYQILNLILSSVSRLKGGRCVYITQSIAEAIMALTQLSFVNIYLELSLDEINFVVTALLLILSVLTPRSQSAFVTRSVQHSESTRQKRAPTYFEINEANIMFCLKILQVNKKINLTEVTSTNRPEHVTLSLSNKQVVFRVGDEPCAAKLMAEVYC